MKISQLFFWRNDRSAEPQPVEAQKSPAPPQTSASSNVIPLVSSSQETDATEGPAEQPAQLALRFRALLEAPELVAFFDEPHFARGRSVGACNGDAELLELSEKQLVARFQNCLVTMAQRRQAKRQRLQLEIAEVEAVSALMAGQLRLASEHLEKEAQLLECQADLAEQSRGWVLQPLNSFRRGFHQGLRETVDFLLLTA